MTKVLKTLANEIKTIKSTMSNLQKQPSYRPFHPFNPNFQSRRYGGGRHGGGRGCGRFGNGQGNERGNGREGGQGRGYQQQRPPRTDTSHYCHTHGACGHSSFSAIIPMRDTSTMPLSTIKWEDPRITVNGSSGAEAVNLTYINVHIFYLL